MSLIEILLLSVLNTNLIFVEVNIPYVATLVSSLSQTEQLG